MLMVTAWPSVILSEAKNFGGAVGKMATASSEQREEACPE
jgi:hypothetical protein